MILGTWGRPPDRPACAALALAALFALVALVPASVHDAFGLAELRGLGVVGRRRLVAVLGFAAAFLSLGYVAYYLRAGPRIIDATSYFLEGKVLSHGHLSWSVPSPSASFRGRFLLFREPDRLAVIFPPGFPLLLAGGFLLGAPLVVGPLLAGALVVATYALARELMGRSDRHQEPVALLAAALSVLCAALRYHTADTMAHAASGFGITLALLAALRAARTGRPAAWVAAGLAVGWVVCTRPVSGLSIGVVVFALAARGGGVSRALVGLVPGFAFLVLASHAQSGRWFASAQAAYYAVSDGPAGCFRYGFGDDVGCRVEHGDFVAARLAHGFGPWEALLTTLRRLRIHLLDVANFELLAPLVLLPAWRTRGQWRVGPPSSGVVAASAVVVGQMLAYAPFYFDGDYPGGGARFFADVLPIEHVLLAMAVASTAPRIPLVRRAATLLALSSLGFAIHAAYEHDALAQRDGARPMYDADEARTALPSRRGILFFDTDHGFDLAFDPYTDPSKAVLAARLRGDDHDRLLVERLDHPQAHVYHREGEHPTIKMWTAKPGGSRDLWRFEAEADWPLLTQHGGWAEPVWASNSCASDGRVLTLHPGPGHAAPVEGPEARVTFDLPVPRAGRWLVQPRVLRRGGRGHGRLRLLPRGRPVRASDPALDWEWDDLDITSKDACLDLPAPEGARAGVELDVAGAEWELTASAGDVSVDLTTLKASR
jgi:hypothetical protein